MALFPCDVGNHHHKLKNITVYSGFLTPGGDLRSRCRLCQLHWGAVEPNLSKYEVVYDSVPAGDDANILPCASCGEPIQEHGAQLFVTAYPTKDDRKDYWLQIHDACGTPGWLPWKDQGPRA